MRYDITNDTVQRWAESYRGEPFHACLGDPPYHLTEITDRFSSPSAAPAQFGKDGAFQRVSKGFMGKVWDGVGEDGHAVAFTPSTWQAIGAHLYPGAFGAMFSGSRGWHRMATAIEGRVGLELAEVRSWADALLLARETRDWAIVEGVETAMRRHLGMSEALDRAGFIIHPTIFGWVYGSGFPKATRVDTGIDNRAFASWLKANPDKRARLQAIRAEHQAARRAKDAAATALHSAALEELSAAYRLMAGLVPPVLGTKKHAPKFAAAEMGYREKDNGFNSRKRESFELTGPATEAAAAWTGHRYGGQALKPALEPIIMFQKPYAGAPIESITRTGAGALNIDAGRIPTGDDCARAPSVPSGPAAFGYSDGGMGGIGSDLGRWPANFALAHHPACNGSCHPGCAVRRLGEQSGYLESGAIRSGQKQGTNFQQTHARIAQYDIESDAGTAARFFYSADWMLERIEAADPVRYIPKPSSL